MLHKHAQATTRFSCEGIGFSEIYSDGIRLQWVSRVLSKNVSAAIKAATALPKADLVQASEANETAWAQESFGIAKQEAYKKPIGVGNGPFTLTNAYKSNAKKVARTRAALAAARLANLLNSELK